MIFRMILVSFDFQCDFDFQITTSKIILIINHLYLGDLILILNSSTYDDFAHLCLHQCHQWDINDVLPRDVYNQLTPDQKLS